MPVAKRLRHQWAAREDLLGIWRYTRDLWGSEQADAYLVEIDRTLQEIAAGHLRGTPYRQAHLKRRIKSHFIFYRETAIEVVIVRVLHVRMDAARWLRD